MNHLRQPKLFTRCFLPLVGNTYVQPATFKKHPLQIRHPPWIRPQAGSQRLCAMRYTRHSSCPGGLTSQEPTKLGFRVLPCDISWLVFSKNYLFCKFFFTVLGLRCSSRAFRGLWYVGFSLQRLLVFHITGSRARASAVKAWGPGRLAICGIPPARGWHCVPCTGRWMLNHWATREAFS